MDCQGASCLVDSDHSAVEPAEERVPSVSVVVSSAVVVVSFSSVFCAGHMEASEG